MVGNNNICWNGDKLKKLSLHVEYSLRLPRMPGDSVLKGEFYTTE